MTKKMFYESLMMQRETGQPLVGERWSGSSRSQTCGQSELRRSVGMRRSTKAVCSTDNVLCMWLVFHQHTQYSIYILSTDPALNVKLFMLSQPLYSDNEIHACVWKPMRVCMCVRFLHRLLCPPPSCGCAVLCSGSNNGFCAL